jgi:hypothetical protein
MWKHAGRALRAFVDDRLICQAEDSEERLAGGGVGLLVETGTIAGREVRVRPL